MVDTRFHVPGAADAEPGRSAATATIAAAALTIHRVLLIVDLPSEPASCSAGGTFASGITPVR
jgi:hypothetical protein